MLTDTDALPAPEIIAAEIARLESVREFVLDRDKGFLENAAEVDVDKPTTFMVRESWHPRWQGSLLNACRY